MLPLLRLLVPFVLYPACAWIVLRGFSGAARMRLFALVNVGGAFGLCVLSAMAGVHMWQLKAFLSLALPLFGMYLLAALANRVLLRALAVRTGWASAVPLLFPILFMLAVRYASPMSTPFQGQLALINKTQIAEFFVGISYMAFRLSHLAMEVRNGMAPMPTISEYLSYAFFVPVMSVGPISRYSVFRQSLEKSDPEPLVKGRAALRILVGATKYLFLAALVEQLGYAGLLMDSHPHPRADLAVAAFAFYMYLYLNFSGYCDMAIGTGGLIGIRIEENFDHPFRSRNIQEFWTRWHITLSTYMRDMVFSPMSKALAHRFGPAAMPHIIALSIFTIFLLMGAWHGLAWNFIIYGCLHGVGVVSCHYYTIRLKRRLGKKGYAAYNDSLWIRAAGVCATFVFVAITLFFFANSLSATRTIWRVFR